MALIVICAIGFIVSSGLAAFFGKGLAEMFMTLGHDLADEYKEKIKK